MMNVPQDDASSPGSSREPRTATTSYVPDAVSDALSGRAGVDRPTFVPRWRRIGVALVGLGALVAALVTLILGIAGVVSLILPLVCVIVAAGAVAVLRVLAVRGRRARVDRAFTAAMAPVRDAAPESAVAAPVVAAPKRPTALFDVEEASVRPPTAMERRTAALAVVHGSSALDLLRVETDTAEPAGATAWAPVEVPRPIYVDAAKAERQAPAPLDLPEAPKPISKTPIKASEAAARAAASDEQTADGVDGEAGSAPAIGRINLDDVLQRRRA